MGICDGVPSTAALMFFLVLQSSCLGSLRELVLIVFLFFCGCLCLFVFRCLFLTVPWVCLWSVIVVFPGHTHLFFKTPVQKIEWGPILNSDTQSLRPHPPLNCSSGMLTIEPGQSKRYNVVCAPSQDSDQPAHLCSLIWVFARHYNDTL